jgi:hypothetical protein
MKSKIAEKVLSETSEETKQKAINYGNSIITKKQEYIDAFLCGYFTNNNLGYGMKYHSILSDAIDEAKKNWEVYEKLKFPNPNIIDQWLYKNGCPEIKKPNSKTQK